MTQHTFSQVDVFTHTPLLGNPWPWCMAQTR